MRVFAAICSALIATHSGAQTNSRSRAGIIEGYPKTIHARLKARDIALRQAVTHRSNPQALSYFIAATKHWTPGQTLTVAFNGGDAALRQRISLTASKWTNYANIHFDFGDGTHFREWHTNDAQYGALIRVSFGQQGYWSYIGTDSLDQQITGAGEASLNLQDFDVNPPADSDAVVLHEFGHALGFLHEHQNPLGPCENDFHWDNDPGYAGKRNESGSAIPDENQKRPGIITYLLGPPNNWDLETITNNLMALPNSSAMVPGPYDGQSIMKYSFPDWMFKDPQHCLCCGSETLDLSEGDKKGAAVLYPRQVSEITKAKTKRVAAFSEIVNEPTASANLQNAFRQKINLLQ